MKKVGFSLLAAIALLVTSNPVNAFDKSARCNALINVLVSGKGGFVALRISQKTPVMDELHSWKAKTTFGSKCDVSETDDEFAYSCYSINEDADEARTNSTKFADEAWECMDPSIWSRQESQTQDAEDDIYEISLKSSDGSEVRTRAIVGRNNDGKGDVDYGFYIPKN